jgi:glycosyltransferase involved in cell wall biosynthesis
MTDEVAFDLRAAGASPTGVGRYLLCIVQALAEHEPGIRLRAYVRDEVAGLPPTVEVVRIGSRGPLWHIRTLWDLRRHRAAVYCSTSLIIPALSGVRCLPVILDVISFLYPEHHTARTKLFEGLLMRRVVRRRPLIAGSMTTQRDIERLFGPARVAVVPPWVPAAAAAREDLDVLDRLGIEPPYALYLGTIEPRKNVATVAAAVAALRKQGSSVKLVVMGNPGWMSDSAMAELSKAVSEGSVVMTGYRPDRERDAVLASASCLVLPSVYEGFGLPILEAMQRGLPCISSTAPVFDEVAGDAVIHVETYDVEAWATAMRDLLADPAVAARLAAAGPDRARKYSPEATARAFVETLSEAR